DVYSPADLPLTDVSILVRNAPVPREQIAVRQSAADPQKWTVTVRDLKLSTGASEIRMTAANRDGQALEPSVHTIRVTVPTPAAPVVTLLGDGKTKGEMTVSSHQVAVRFRVTPIVSREDVRFFV